MKVAQALRLWASGGAPQERDHLRTGAGCIRAERGGAGSLGNTRLNRPHDSIVEVVAFLHINERIDHGLLDLDKGAGDGNLGGGHGELVVGHTDFIATGILDFQCIQCVAGLGRDGQGDGSALLRGGGAGLDAAVGGALR